MSTTNTQLKNKFQTLLKCYSNDKVLIQKLWDEIEIKHSEKHRAYHTLKHLESFFVELKDFKLSDNILFAIFYHDIIYDTQTRDNEEQSALFSEEALAILGVKEKITREVTKLILETKSHEASTKENELFLDADIAILGSTQANYNSYAQAIRYEYNIFTDEAYHKGRILVIESFLKKERIYKSDYFYEKYEKKARKNLEKERHKLSNLLT